MSRWTDLGAGIRVRQSRAYAMNSAVLLDPEHAVLVDAGVLPSDLEDLASAVREAGPRAVTLAFTHSHWDHVLARPWWPEAAILAHESLAAEIERERASILREAASCAAQHGETWTRGFEPFAPDEVAGEERTLDLGRWRLVARHAPGHCDSQITVHLPAGRLLIAGDMLSDIEIPWLDREPAAYARTLRDLLPLVEGGEVETLVPGHGGIAHGAAAVLARLRRDLAYLESLGAGAREARAAGRTREETQGLLATVEHPALSAPGMAEVHRENVRLAWERAGSA